MQIERGEIEKSKGGDKEIIRTRKKCRRTLRPDRNAGERITIAGGP